MDGGEGEITSSTLILSRRRQNHLVPCVRQCLVQRANIGFRPAIVIRGDDIESCGQGEGQSREGEGEAHGVCIHSTEHTVCRRRSPGSPGAADKRRYKYSALNNLILNQNLTPRRSIPAQVKNGVDLGHYGPVSTSGTQFASGFFSTGVRERL